MQSSWFRTNFSGKCVNQDLSTSDPFSLVFSTHTLLGGVTVAKYIGTVWVRKWPYLTVRFGIVFNARTYKP